MDRAKFFAAVRKRVANLFKLKLIPEWRGVLRRAWSIRLIVIAGILSGCEVGLPYINELTEIPRGVFAALTIIVCAGAFIARTVAQENFREKPNAEQ
jgi:hypothetical protein